MKVTLVTSCNSEGKHRHTTASAHVQSDWPRIKDDAVSLALRELPDRKEKESLSLSGLQLAFGFVRVPDNVSSNLRQLLRVTQARPPLCHELSLLSSEANPQKASLNKTTQTFTVMCCNHRSTVHLGDEVLDSMGNKTHLVLLLCDDFSNVSKL